jgi:DNA-binding NarL/FixJ family response regulator
MSQRRKILVIEDQPVMRRNIAMLLEMEGYLTATAADGIEGNIFDKLGVENRTSASLVAIETLAKSGA